MNQENADKERIMGAFSHTIYDHIRRNKNDDLDLLTRCAYASVKSAVDYLVERTEDFERGGELGCTLARSLNQFTSLSIGKPSEKSQGITVQNEFTNIQYGGPVIIKEGIASQGVKDLAEYVGRHLENWGRFSRSTNFYLWANPEKFESKLNTISSYKGNLLYPHPEFNAEHLYMPDGELPKINIKPTFMEILERNKNDRLMQIDAASELRSMAELCYNDLVK